MPNLEAAVTRYRQALTTLEYATPEPTVQQVLATLAARDAIHRLLTDKTENIADYLLDLKQLDNRLKQQTETIANVSELADLRHLSNPSPEAWWWFLNHDREEIWNRFDWLWSALTVPWLAINLSLIVDISSRFLGGSPDTIGTFAIVFQSILAALATGGALTKTGQDLVEGIFVNLKVPKRFRDEVKLASAILLSIALIGFRASLPSVAVFYNERGFRNFSDGKLDSAKQDFLQALKLNPDFMEAHYNLGQMYESLQDNDNALTQYKSAAEAGSSRAYSTIGRLYNVKGDYSSAIYFLLKGKSLLEKKAAGSSVDGDRDTEYAILRNLGWARLGQARYSDAKGYLETAIRLVPDRVSGHCLLAQVLKGEKQSQAALESWKRCREYAAKLPSDKVPLEVDAWVGLAAKELKP